MSVGSNKKVREDVSSLLPSNLPQNPAPTGQSGQQYITSKQDLTDSILNTFYQLLPSNYVSQITGPYYVLQYQAIAEALAEVQILAQQVHLDTQVDFTRPEFLWQTLGTLVFPEVDPAKGPPKIEGDVSYREFLKVMLGLLVQGSTLETQKKGIEALADTVQVEVRAKSTEGPRGYVNQHVFEAETQGCASWVDAQGQTVTGTLGTGFGGDPVVFQSNVDVVLRALKPGHVLHEFRHVLVENFSGLFTDELTSTMQFFHYQDWRKNWGGNQAVEGSAGVTLTDRTLFSDPTRDFTTILPGSQLTLRSGRNAPPAQGGEDSFYKGVHVVQEVLRLPFPTDATPQAYTTSPTGLSGSATVTGGVIEDSSQDWSQAVEGEILTFPEGLNAGSYRIERLLGPNGGYLGQEGLGPAVSQIAVAPCLLRLESRMPYVQTGQEYAVSIERGGVKVPYTVVGEDVSSQLL